MERDPIIQILILFLTLTLFYLLHTLPKRLFVKLRSNPRPNNQAHRHFIQGAQHLSQAHKSTSPKSKSKFANSAITQADLALSHQPKDPAAHILKAMAQSLLGHKTSALKSLDTALSIPCVKMLSGTEKGDALFRRAELVVELNKRRRIDSVILDLVEAVGLCPDNNTRMFCLLGKCYEGKGLMDDAGKAFRDALEVEPELDEARLGLERVVASRSLR